jgi:acyl-CoA synthetase (AMP-forming)/AMP-acid ligase II
MTVAATPKFFAPVDERKTFVDVLHQRAIESGDVIAYTFLADGAGDARSITWSQLDSRAASLAAVLHERGAAGQRVLLALPSGLTFIESLFACWYAGAIAVPLSLPRHHRVKHRLQGIIADADARFAIGAVDARERSGISMETAWIDPATIDSRSTAQVRKNGERIALLQYTSGSTGVPRGVVVTHRNLMHNSALIQMACGLEPGHNGGGWLPLYHDMGLISILQAAYCGARCVLMPPERFLMRPWLWLEMISKYRISSSPAPNFAYDLCVERISAEQKNALDLSCWRNALNGAEPVRAATLDRFANAFTSCGFRREAFYPCYGLAESTLFVSGPGEIRKLSRRTADGNLLSDDEPGGHVACGKAFGDTQIAIVDPKTCSKVPAGAIGEIWIAGASVTDGYWKNPDATAATFNAHLNSTNDHGEKNIGWLRTGDLGFMKDEGLFITGRLSDLIIIAGRNHFPVDIEQSVEKADAAIATFGAAVFSVDISSTERLIVVAELRRELAAEIDKGLDLEKIRRNVRGAISAEHELSVHEVVLLQPGALPRTTSGKISRRFTRDAYLNRTLERAGESKHVHADA